MAAPQSRGKSKRKNELAWAQLAVVTQYDSGDPLVHCEHCDKEFVGGASRIVAHFIGDGKNSIRVCENAPEYLIEELQQYSNTKAAAKAKKARIALLEKALNTHADPARKLLDPKTRRCKTSKYTKYTSTREWHL